MKLPWTLGSGVIDRNDVLYNNVDEILVLTPSDEGIMITAFSADSVYLAIGGRDNVIYIYNMSVADPTSQQPTTLSGHTNWVWGLSWSPTGHTLASASSDTTIRVWGDPWAENPTPRVIPGQSEILLAVAWDPAGDRLAAVGVSATVRVYTTLTLEEVAAAAAALHTFSDINTINYHDVNSLNLPDALLNTTALYPTTT